MFNLRDKVKVYSGEHKYKEGIIICMDYPPLKSKEIPVFTLELDDKTRIKVFITDL